MDSRPSSTRRTAWHIARTPDRSSARWSLVAERVACRAAQAVISVSRTDLADLEHRRFVRAGRGFHIANAVRTPAANGAARTSARRRLGLPIEAVVVGTVSRLVPQKAVGDLIEAVARIAPGFGHSSAAPVLVIVGDGPLRADLERRVQAGANGARVLLLGERGDVPQILPAFDPLFALSSHWEGEPIALLEAMAAGLPCVATATEGSQEVLDDASSGRLVPVGDVAKLGDALASLLRDASAREALGASARARVSEPHARSSSRPCGRGLSSTPGGIVKLRGIVFSRAD